MSEQRMKHDVLLTVYYVNKLVEGGFVAGGPKLTVLGFDTAMDLIESGYKLSRDTVEKCVAGLELKPAEAFTTLVLEVQEMGLPAMVEKSKNIVGKMTEDVREMREMLKKMNENNDDGC